MQMADDDLYDLLQSGALRVTHCGR
jgi:hypothetical protein